MPAGRKVSWSGARARASAQRTPTRGRTDRGALDAAIPPAGVV